MKLFDGGYEKLRETIFENQKKLGLVPQDAKLAPWPAEKIKPWDQLTDNEKKLFIKQVEVFAAYAAYTDYEIGRVIQAVDDMGKLDDTLVIYINGDNGTSAEGGPMGTPNEVAWFNGIADMSAEEQLKWYDVWGTEQTYNQPMIGVPQGDSPSILNDSSKIRDAIRRLAQAKSDERVAATVAAGSSSARSRASAAVEKAEQELADAIDEAVRDIFPAEISGNESWVDPFVGLRGRLNFSRQVYFSARADIGGFGVGSELAWNAQAALGVQLSRSFSAELGYRYLSMDYSDTSFLFDASISGLYLGLNYTF